MCVCTNVLLDICYQQSHYHIFQLFYSHTYIITGPKVFKYLIGASEPFRILRENKHQQRALKLKEYDSTTCKHSFCPQRNVNWPWLREEQTDEKELMFCDFCIKAGVSAGKKTNFVNGC